jgi:DNA-binding response OmpR family regulator
MSMRQSKSRPLEGLRVLIVEDNALLLLDLEATLHEAGAQVIGAVTCCNESLLLLERTLPDAAILDFQLVDETSAPIARRLTSARIPFLFHTGQENHDHRLEEWPERRVLVKPALPCAVIAAVKALVAPHPGAIGPPAAPSIAKPHVPQSGTRHDGA